MVESVYDILQLLVAGGVVAATLNILYHKLSSDRQYQQTLNQKMIDRISLLVEQYYGQISSSSDSLRNALTLTVLPLSQGVKANSLIQISFYRLLVFLHHIERLAQERPIPLFTEIKAEKDYKQRIFEVYENLPFDYFDISLLLDRFRHEEGLLPAYKFIALIEKDKDIKLYYEMFSKWLYRCKCNRGNVNSCNVHKIIAACVNFCLIMQDQTLKMYRLWYKRRKRRPKDSKK